jgi:hypothetical protein
MKKIFSICILILFAAKAIAQGKDSTLDLLDQGAPVQYTEATFKATRLVNFHTVETAGNRTLDFRISHRFGNISDGAYNLWGLDGPADLRLGLEYSYSSRWEVGVGRTTQDKLYDGFFKYQLLRQREDNKMPVTVTLLASTDLTTMKDPNAAFAGYDKYQYFSDRLSYVFQAMIARKFNERLSLQISPTLVHYNLVTNTTDKNDVYTVVALGRYKLSQRFALTAEYAPRINQYTANMNQFHNSASLGVDIETGGHVFQVFVTNSFGIQETQTIANTTNTWTKGQLILGFNISRYFTL